MNNDCSPPIMKPGGAQGDLRRPGQPFQTACHIDVNTTTASEAAACAMCVNDLSCGVSRTKKSAS